MKVCLRTQEPCDCTDGYMRRICAAETYEEMAAFLKKSQCEFAAANGADPIAGCQVHNPRGAASPRLVLRVGVHSVPSETSRIPSPTLERLVDAIRAGRARSDN